MVWVVLGNESRGTLAIALDAGMIPVPKLSMLLITEDVPIAIVGGAVVTPLPLATGEQCEPPSDRLRRALSWDINPFIALDKAACIESVRTSARLEICASGSRCCSPGLEVLSFWAIVMAR